MVKSSTQESNSFIFVSATNKSYWIGHLLILQICSQITHTVNANPQTKMHKISEPKGMDFKSETLCISNGFLSIHAGIITQSTRQFHIIFIYGWHFADTLFKCIFVTENLFLLIYVSFKFASKGSIDNQGWGQFQFFNSIPIPLFSIPIPIPLLPISFNSNSGHFNSNSNSGEFKSNLNSRNDLLMSSSTLIMIMITRYMHIRLFLLIPSVSYPLLNGYNYVAYWLIPYQ